MEYDMPDHVLLDTPIAEGVTFYRDKAGTKHTNVPRLVIDHSPDGYEWGYGGSGPADFALNIVENVLRHLKYNGPRQIGFDGQGSCFDLSYRLHQDFKWRYIATAENKKNHISLATIIEFIDKGLAKHKLGRVYVSGLKSKESPS